MGILADFLAKHIRPVGDGWNLLAEDAQLRDVLGSWGLSETDINGLYLNWKQVRDLRPDSEHARARFVEVARSVSNGRWDELYTTSASTVLFMDAAQIKELSHAGNLHRNTKRLEVFIAQPAVVAAVTIHRTSDRAEFADPLPKGIEVATGAAGNVNHFWELL